MNRFKTLIREILDEEVFEKKPPVLIDVGASGEIFKKWKSISDKSVCIAFDADDRDFRSDSIESKDYKKLYKINRIVSAEKKEKCKFYLTKSPHCSSCLLPDEKSLSQWVFADLFKIEKVIELPCITLNDALKTVEIDYIDWFKVDSQGLDMDIFLSIQTEIRENILAADFEPGIIDAYKGENKLSSLLETIEKENFWISTFAVQGTQRLSPEYQKYKDMLHQNPCWVEITSLKNKEFVLNKRNVLLLIVFALIENQWGFALQICDTQNEQIFTDIKKNIFHTVKRVNSNKKVFSFIKKVFYFIKRIIKRFIYPKR